MNQGESHLALLIPSLLYIKAKHRMVLLKILFVSSLKIEEYCFELDYILKTFLLKS